MTKLFLLLFLTAILINCGKAEENNNCAGIICPTTAYCSNGMCNLKPGRCITNNDCNNGYICDPNFNCVNPNNPCENQTCSNFGTCFVTNNLAQCNCLSGYLPDGLSCVAKTCTNGEVKNNSCGPDGEVQSQICQYGIWINQGLCLCVDTSKRIQACNGDGIQYQTCTAGIWNNTGDCIGTVCSVPGESRNVMCGFNGNGNQNQVCMNSKWTNTGTCTDSDVCSNGKTQLIADSVCANQSLNGRGQKEQFCTNGQWIDYEGNCKDPDVCKDGTETNCQLGLTCKTGQCVSCNCGTWETCSNGYCLLNEGKCDSNNDCLIAGESCNLTTHNCEITNCSPACNSWETCNTANGTCILNAGNCNANSDCGNGKVCNTNHTCEFTCLPACKNWETCNTTNGTCGLSAGRCYTDSDCSIVSYVCNQTTHICDECTGLSVPSNLFVFNSNILGFQAQITSSLLLSIEFNTTPEVGSYSLTSSINSNYQSCEQCILLYNQINASTTKLYFQTRGTLNITVLEAGRIAGNIINVKLVEVTIDSNSNYSTPVSNGKCYEIETATIDYTGK